MWPLVVYELCKKILFGYTVALMADDIVMVVFWSVTDFVCVWKQKLISKADINKFTVTNSNMKKKIQDLEASDVFSFSWRLTRKAWVCLWPPTL